MTLILIAGSLPGSLAAELKPATSGAFERYLRQAEQKLNDRQEFLWADENGDRHNRILKGQIVVEPARAKPLTQVDDGLVHDWVGAVFIPGVSLASTLEHVRDYDHASTHHREVIDSRILSHDGNDYRVFMKLLKKKVITVVLNTEHEIHYYPMDATHWRSQSKTVKIAEVENHGKRDEHELAAGAGHGFLWKLDTYWRFEERDGGTWIECEAISLTRDIPTGLGWLIEPIIKSLPKESLENTLRETAASLVKK